MNYVNAKEISSKKKAHSFFQRYRHGLILLYLCLYLPWFSYLEDTVTSHFHEIHMALDDKIPFIEYFIVPYLLWFAYVAIAVVYFFFKNKGEYYRLCGFLFTGMTIFLIVSTVFPNGHHLRPQEFARDNVFTQLVQYLYKIDTPTNLFPSIHVYNSIGVNIAVWHCEELKKKNGIRVLSALLMASIILSTLFLKQHSLFDVITAMALSVFMYTLVYARSLQQVGERKAALEDYVRHV